MLIYNNNKARENNSSVITTQPQQCSLERENSNEKNINPKKPKLALKFPTAMNSQYPIAVVC